MGAGRARILRQLVTESILLSGLAGLLGLPLASRGIRGLIALAPQGIVRLEEARIDVPVLAFSFGLSLATGLLFGLAPAIRTSRDTAASRHTRGVESRAMRRAFVLAEIALAVVLLTGAGLVIRSLAAVESVEPGFRTSRVLTAALRYPNTVPREEQAERYRQAIARLGQAPGIYAAGAVETMFYAGNDSKFGLRAVEGKPAEARQQWTPMTWTTISGDYFQALGVPLMEGRMFDERDRADRTPVVIINETMARRYWPGEDPIGKGIKGFDPRGRNDEWVRVVGVVKDMHSNGLDRAPIAQIYEAQAQSQNETEALVLQTSLTEEALRGTLRSIDPMAVMTDLAMLKDQLAEQTAPRRFQALLLGLFAALALLLAAAGIFAMMHYSVTQRTQEIGIRMAIGAGRPSVVRMVLREAFLLLGVGITLGMAGSLMLTRFLRSLLFEVGPGDPLTLASVALLLTGTASLACYFPALRATRVDPIRALRCD